MNRIIVGLLLLPGVRAVSVGVAAMIGRDMTSPRRVAIVAPMVPYDAPPHAGGLYLQAVVRFAELHGPTTVVVPNTPTNRQTATAIGAPADLVVVGSERAERLSGRAARRVVAVADARLRRIDPGMPSLTLADGMWRPGPGRTALEAADVVDLQWSESIRLARLVRRINPGARVVGTYHDVQSQLFSREPATTLRGHTFWRRAVWQARRHERRGVVALDDVAVFSEKDARLLGGPAHARVIHPPLATGTEEFPESPPGPPTVLFVAHFARAENDEGARWLLREVWPAVMAVVPDARLRLVGRGVSEGLQALCDDRPEVTAAGFVPDLEPEYAAARLCVVPLRQGAGVKFKTVEALLHGVPVVTTPVGAEGIEGPDLFAGLTTDPSRFAALMTAVLVDSRPARDRSRLAQVWAAAEYSSRRFTEQMLAHYGIG
jgi:glycosyltransferase involved in cell wall biosynthesis